MTVARSMDYRHETEAQKTFYLHWATCGIDPPFNKVNFIFCPYLRSQQSLDVVRLHCKVLGSHCIRSTV